MFQPRAEIASLKQSSIRAASQRCQELNGINLGQGLCDVPIEQEIIKAAHDAMQTGKNLYSAKEGIFSLREKLVEKINDYNRIPVAIENVMISHGSTGAFVSAVETLFVPGDEIILFEPFYGYHKKLMALKELAFKTVSFDARDFSFSLQEFENQITDKTKAIVICTPCNPCGKVFSKDELLALGKIAKKYNLWVICDEIYEYIVYPGFEHISFASLADFKNFTITISGFSKTYNMTGWRLGYASGPQAVIEKMALVQDLMYVCPATPLQYGALGALQLPASYYENMKTSYLQKRDFMVKALNDLGFKTATPQGAYYLMADVSSLGFQSDVEAVEFLLEKARVATVTGRSFFLNPSAGQNLIRFCYGLSLEKLEQAIHWMQKALQKYK